MGSSDVGLNLDSVNRLEHNYVIFEKNSVQLTFSSIFVRKNGTIFSQ